MSDDFSIGFWAYLLIFRIGKWLVESKLFSCVSFCFIGGLTSVCRLFELFTNILDLLISNARKEGQFDFGIVDIKANVIELRGSPKVQDA